MGKHSGNQDNQPTTAPTATVTGGEPEPGSGDMGASFDAQHAASAQRSLESENGERNGKTTPNGFSRVSPDNEK